MSDKQRTIRGFTLVELLVAIGILAMVMAFASAIFRVSVGSHRTALANSEIMQKFRAITDQLNADFRGLRKDGEIFVVWVATPRIGADPTDPNEHERFDRIMFFANGDYQSYGIYPKIVRGNVARICYMLARRGSVKAYAQPPEKRMLARTQHILITDDPELNDFLYPGMLPSVPDVNWLKWNNQLEYDEVTLQEWKNIPWVIDANVPTEPREPNKPNMLTVTTDIGIAGSRLSEDVRGAQINPAEPNSVHMILCEGVGEFMIQGWSWDDTQLKWRWVPEIDPDGNGSLDYTDFFLDPVNPTILHQEGVPGVLYPYPPYGGAYFGGELSDPNLYRGILNENNFNMIPGLGRALKFTFTLYDSRGVIKGGRTFTHIVYLD